MKPNLPLPPNDMRGFFVTLVHEDDIDHEVLSNYEFAEPNDVPGMPGYGSLYRSPTDG